MTRAEFNNALEEALQKAARVRAYTGGGCEIALIVTRDVYRFLSEHAGVTFDVRNTDHGIYRGYRIGIVNEQGYSDIGVPREDSALGLPLGMETKIVCKHNMRNLMDMSHQRMCNRAYHEYRGLFNDVCDALGNYSEEWKYIVDHYFMPKCKLMGFCSEKKTCGMMPRKQ